MARTLKIPKLKGEKTIWVVAILLALASLLAVYTAISIQASADGDGATRALFKHIFLLAMALVIMVVSQLVPSKLYCNLSTVLLLIIIPLLLLTLRKGQDTNNAKRALMILGTTFQTSEVAKVLLINYLAAHLYLLRDKLTDLKTVIIKLFLPVTIVTGLVMPPNMSMAVIIFVDSLVILFVGGVKVKHLLGFFGAAVVLGGLYIGYKLTLPPEQQGRVGTWKNRIERFASDDNTIKNNEEGNAEKFDPFDDIHRQQTCSKIAIASGGLIGRGSGHSQQRNFLYLSHSDFIFAIIVEEYGILLGGGMVLFLYIFLIFCGFKVLKKHPDTYGGLVTFGLTFMIVSQAFINMGVAVTLFPVTGQPLPFISTGGTALWATGLAFGIILSATKNLNKNSKENEKDNSSKESVTPTEYIVNEENNEPIILVRDE